MTTNPITTARHALADVCREAIPDLPVFASPPTQVAAPCILILLQSATQSGAGLWHQTFRVELWGPGGDNEAATQSIEDMLWLLAPAISAKFSTKVEWEDPSLAVSVSQTYYTAAFTVIIDVS